MTGRWWRGVAIALGAVTWAGSLGAEPAGASPVAIKRQQVKVGRHSWAVTTLRADLADPKTQLAVRFAFDTGRALRRREAFAGMTRDTSAAALVNGTFFSVRTADTMGTVVSGGKVLQHRDWDDRGTALTIDATGRARIATLRLEGRPDHARARFSITSGPRLVRDGKVWLQPKREGFRDPSLFGRHPRMALGLTKGGRQLIVACFPSRMTLGEAAQAMRSLGVHDALNLDGGPSVGMAYRGKIVAKPRWGLTNALVFYDAQHPGPVRLDGSMRQALARKDPSPAETPEPAAHARISSSAPKRPRAPEACYGRLGKTARSGR